MNEITVKFPDGVSIQCPYGMRVETLVDRFGPLPHTLVAVRGNNEVIPLSTRLEVNVELKPVTLESSEGTMIYRRSLAFLLAVAARELFPDRSLVIGHSLGNGYFYAFKNDKSLEEGELEALDARMREIVKADYPIAFRYQSYADALATFQKNGQTDTAILMEQLNDAKVPVNECRGFMDLSVATLVPRTSVLKIFELRAYETGFLLRYPGKNGSNEIAPFEDSPRIFSVYKEYKKWGRIVGISSVGDINDLVNRREIKSFIQISEAFQNKKLSEVADQIFALRDKVRVILIAGPSSSGKTTTAKRLSIHLKVMGLEPLAISLDDYYLGVENTPKDEKGQPDFECLEALDVPYLNEQLLALFRGDEIELPIFDFKSGARKSGGKKIKLGRRSVVVIEGIHGLNDKLTAQIERDMKFKVYVSALTQLNLDDHNRIPTSDNRLLRRMVRDYQFRGSTAANTIRMWPSVQAGEKKHIFPFQDGADVAFNSALDYELAILKVYAEPLLRSVKPTMDQYAEASRLLSFLDNFAPVPPQYVPGQSILREFIGESEFKY
ncbi:MAG: nucleoside kinase [Treponemataceae bacterium]